MSKCSGYCIGMLLAMFASSMLQAKNIEITISNWLPGNVYVTYRNCEEAEASTQQVTAGSPKKIYVDALDDDAAMKALIAQIMLYSPSAKVISTKPLVALCEKTSPALWDGINMCISQVAGEKATMDCLAYKRPPESAFIQPDDFETNAGYNGPDYVRRERLWPDVALIKPILVREKKRCNPDEKNKHIRFKDE